MNKRLAKLIQKTSLVKPTDKKWADIRADWVQMYVEGWNEDFILNALMQKYYMKASTLKTKLPIRELKQQALQEITKLKKSGKYRLPQYENTASQKFKQAEFSGVI